MDNTSDTYTQLSAQDQNIQSLSSAVSSGVSGLPGINAALRKSLYEREKTLPGLESEMEGKITELYTADKRYAERYAAPESEMYLEDPMKRQALVSGQKADVRGELGNILNLIQQRQQTLGNALDKGMELYKYGLEAQKAELDAAEKAYGRMWEKYQFGEEMDFKEKQLAKSGSAGTKTATNEAALSEVYKYLSEGVRDREEALRDAPLLMSKYPSVANNIQAAIDYIFPKTDDDWKGVTLEGKNFEDKYYRVNLQEGKMEEISPSGTLQSTEGAGEERINVRIKATGQTGTIPASEFDDNVYERI